MPTVSTLYRYPIKSTAAEALQLVSLDSLGLVGDRRWLVVEKETGRFLTQRTCPQLGRIRARWRSETILTLTAPGLPVFELSVPHPDEHLREVTIWKDTLQVPDAGDAVAAWLERCLAVPVRLVHMPLSRARQIDERYAARGQRVHYGGGFPLLLVNQASLDDLSSRIGREMTILRFRPNIVVEGSPAYAEDRWRRLRIGEIEFLVAKPCSRCIITTIDPETGMRSLDHEPLATLRRYRQVEEGILFGQNLIAQNRGILRSGMTVEILASV